MDFHFLHAADIHLDRALKGLPAAADSPPELLTAPRTAFVNLVDEAIGGGAAFMILAGDLYDSEWKDYSTGYFFQEQMGRLDRAGVRVVLLYGNHDADQAMTKTLVPPANVYTFGSAKPETIRFDDLHVALHGQSFRLAATTDNLAAAYPAPVPGYLNIGVLHTALEGYPPHGLYAPCTLSQLCNAGYDYWALGHVHGHKVLAESPWVVYPGNLQGLHVNEPGPRGALRVPVSGGTIGRPQRVLVDVLRWARLEIDIAQASELSDIPRLVSDAMRQCLEDADGRHVCARVRLIGMTPLHGDLISRRPQINAEIRGQAIALQSQQLHIERVEIATTAPSSSETIAARGDALAELQRYLLAATSEPEFLAGLQAALAPVVSDLPLGISLDDYPHLAAVRDGQLSDMLEALAPAVLDHISKG